MMRLMSLKQYMKMSKPALIRKITNTIRKMPKKRLAVYAIILQSQNYHD